MVRESDVTGYKVHGCLPLLIVILPSGEKLENQVWTYLTPLAEAGKLKELVAFYVPGPKFKLVVDGQEITI